MDTTSFSLLYRLRDSDKASWNRFVAIYSPMLTRWARAQGMQESDAADLVQDVLVVLVKKLPEFQYDPSKSFRAWLKAILNNKYRDRVRRKQNHQPQPGEGELEEVPEQSSIFSEAEYRREVMSRALDLLRPDFQAHTWNAFVEHGLKCRPAAEVATKLNMSEAAVYVSKSRVLARLKEEVAELLS